MDRRLVCAIALGSGPDAWGSKGPAGWALLGWELLLAAEPTAGSTCTSCVGPTPETSLIEWVGITGGEPTPVASWDGLGWLGLSTDSLTLWTWCSSVVDPIPVA